jgi:DNA uptake protein ComE-like DNA-binding protein
MDRLLYLLSFMGIALFARGHYLARTSRPHRQPKGAEPEHEAPAAPVRRARRERRHAIDLNRASDADLQKLGLADFRDRIIDERPFHNKIDLLERMIVPNELYREIKDRITVRHAA